MILSWPPGSAVPLWAYINRVAINSDAPLDARMIAALLGLYRQVLRRRFRSAV